MAKNRREPAPVDNRFASFLPLLLIFCYAAQAFWHARDKSPTYDESGHLTVSYLLSRTAHQDYDIGHPPFIRKLFALPLVAMDPSLPDQIPRPEVPEATPLSERPPAALYYYSSYFLFGNRLPAEKLILAARSVNILLGCLLGFWICRWSSRLYGKRAGILTLALLAFCPNLIAHGSLVTTDMGGIAFACGFLYAWTRLLESDNLGSRLTAGILLGLALLSKYTNIFLVPLFAGLHFFLELRSQAQKSAREILKTVLAVLFAAWFTLCLGYGFQKVFTSHELQESDWQNLGYGKVFRTLYRFAPLPDSFIKGICFAVSHDKRGHGAFFMGEYSGAGWPSYFPAAFLLKTPVTTLGLLALWLFLLIRKKIAFDRRELLIFLPVLFLVCTSMTAKVNIGLRHILLVYPLLYVLLGKIASLPFFETEKGRMAGLATAGVLAFETLSIAPHYLAFFNRAAGGPEKGIDYLSDSNIDWGQDLKNLAEFVRKEGNPELILSYFGTAVPQYYGLRFQGLPTVWSFPRSEHVNSPQPLKEYLAVSVTNLQGTYFGKHDLYGWLRGKEPVKKLGYSLYVYDITRDKESQEKLLEIYRMTGEEAKALRQENRAAEMR